MDATNEVHAHVAPGSVLLTDDHGAYKWMSRTFKHFTVRHSAGEYVRDHDIHTNSLEGVWSLFKRQIYGIHHWISEKHLQRYLSEMTWRYDRRALQDGTRMNEFLSRVDGRLTYKALIE
jgi:hypothetical protein